MICGSTGELIFRELLQITIALWENVTYSVGTHQCGNQMIHLGNQAFFSEISLWVLMIFVGNDYFWNGVRSDAVNDDTGSKTVKEDINV